MFIVRFLIDDFVLLILINWDWLYCLEWKYCRIVFVMLNEFFRCESSREWLNGVDKFSNGMNIILFF